MLAGVYSAKKKNGTTYYRSNITYKGKHISLGSFQTPGEAHQCYLEAQQCIQEDVPSIEAAADLCSVLPFDKLVSLINFRDHGMYIKNPIYLHSNYISYYLSPELELKFDVDDLFYYSSHRIIKRGSYLYVNDYGNQTSILTRYGIHSFSVAGRDYIFSNGDDTDYRYSNIRVINKYTGVYQEMRKGKVVYVTRIHINGNYDVGTYAKEVDAAIAYNKAVDTVHASGVHKDYITNYIVELTAEEYWERYDGIRISQKLLNYLKKFTVIK